MAANIVAAVPDGETEDTGTTSGLVVVEVVDCNPTVLRREMEAVGCKAIEVVLESWGEGA